MRCKITKIENKGGKSTYYTYFSKDVNQYCNFVIIAAHHHHHHHEGTVKSAHCSSEPRLTDNDISPGLRRRGSRRGQSMHHHRKSNAFLDVPDTSSQMPAREEGEDEDSYRLRSFSLTSKGELFY